MRDGLDQACHMVSKGRKAHRQEERKYDPRRPISVDAAGQEQTSNHQHVPGHPTNRIVPDPDAMAP